MISCIATNNKNDWYLTNKCITINQGFGASNQAITNMLRLWIQEWLFNKQVGMNYPQLLSPTGNVNEQDLFEFSIRKILAPYSGTVNWFNSHGNWNAYLKQNFDETTYNTYKTTVQDIIITYKDYKLTADITIKYGNGTIAELSINTANKSNEQTINKQIKLNGSKGDLIIKLFSGTSSMLPIGAIMIRYLKASEGGLFLYADYANLIPLYPESLIQNICSLSPWRPGGISDKAEMPYIKCPNNCQIEIIGIPE